MTQQSFDFGPSHNTRNPATDTSSSAGIDDLISKLGSMLSLTPKSNDNLAEILKKAVKEGIEEAQKSDARTDDSEERAAERHHKEIVNELKRIASLGGGKGYGGGSDTDEKKKDDELSFSDIIKWGVVAGGVATLISNLDLLTSSFNDSVNKVIKFKDNVTGYITETEKFSERMGKIVNESFTKEGAIGLLIGAFSPGGLLAKAVLGFLGLVTGGQVGAKLKEWGVDADSVSMGGMAGGLAAMKLGGPPIMRGLEFLGGFALGDHVTSSFTGETSLAQKVIEQGENVIHTAPDQFTSFTSNFSLPSVANILGISNNQDTTVSDIDKEIVKLQQAIKDNKTGGLSKSEFYTQLGKKPIEEQNQIGEEIKARRKDFEKKIEELTAAKEKYIQEQEDAKDPYGAKIRQYDKEIKELKELQEKRSKMGVVGTTGDYNTRQREQIKLTAQISELEKNKEQFINENKAASIADLQRSITSLDIPTDPTAGQSNYFGASAATAIATGGAFGMMFGGPGGAGVGAAAAFALDSATELFVTTIEQYIINDLKLAPINFIDLVTKSPTVAVQLLKKYADDNPAQAAFLFGTLSAAALAPGSVGKTIVGLIKNIPTLGIKTVTYAGKGALPTAIGSVTNTSWDVFSGVGGSASRALTAGGIGGSITALTLGQNDNTTGLPSVFNPLVPTPSLPTAPSLPGGGAALPTDNTRNDSSGSWGNVFGDMVNRFSGGSFTAIPQNPVNVPQGNAPTTFNGKPLTHDMFKGDNRTFDNHNFVNDGLTTVIKTNKGTQIEVATNRASQFLGFLNELEGKGYNIRVKGGLGNRHGSTTTPKDSLHNLGLAIDINPRENPYAKHAGAPLVTDMGKYNVGAMARRYGLKWGGEWDRPDAMHFEVDKSLRTAEEDNKNIANSIFAKRAMGLTGNTSQNPMEDLIGQILRTESHGNPNAFWGDKSGKYDDLLGRKQLSQLTFAELREFQKKLTERTRGFDPKHPDKGTSAAGIGQWVGSTLFGENYDNTGFLKDYFGGKNYDNEVFSLDRQKDMFKSFLKSKKYGNLEGFLGSNMSSEAYATQLGNQWQGVQNPEEKQRLIATLDKLKKSPHANIDKELDNLMAQMDSLVSTSDKFNNAMGDVGKAVKSALSSLGDFFKNIMEEAPKLLPDELKALVDMPGVLDFLEPLFGGESRSTLAHPTRTLEKGDILKVKSMILGKSVEELQAMESAKLNNVEITPLTNGNDLLYTSKRVADNKSRANNNYLGDIINMTAAQTHQGESVKGNIFNGAGGYTDTHHPGDRDAFAINIYSYGDGPAFYNSGGTGPFGF